MAKYKSYKYILVYLLKNYKAYRCGLWISLRSQVNIHVINININKNINSNIRASPPRLWENWKIKREKEKGCSALIRPCFAWKLCGVPGPWLPPSLHRTRAASVVLESCLVRCRHGGLQRKKKEAREVAPLVFRGRESEGLERGQKCFVN